MFAYVKHRPFKGEKNATLRNLNHETRTSNNAIHSQQSLTVSICINIKHKHSELKHIQEALHLL